MTMLQLPQPQCPISAADHAMAVIRDLAGAARLRALNDCVQQFDDREALAEIELAITLAGLTARVTNDLHAVVHARDEVLFLLAREARQAARAA